MNTDELLMIEENIIHKTENFTHDLNKAENLKNEINVLKNTLSQDLTKTSEEVKKLSTTINQMAKKLTNSLSQRTEKGSTNLSDDSVDELAIAVRNLQVTMSNKNSSTVQYVLLNLIGNMVVFLFFIFLY